MLISWKKAATIVVLTLAFAAAGTLFYFAISASSPAPHGGDSGEVERMEAGYAFLPEDKRRLVGFAHNVFVGRVLTQVGAEPMPAIIPPDQEYDGTVPVTPNTQFSVEVLDNIKGTLQGIITVNQTGGHDPRTHAMVLFVGDSLLEPGQVVLFATRFDESNNWHNIIVQPQGNVRITDAAQRVALISKFERAKAEQIDPVAEMQGEGFLPKPYSPLE